MLLNDVLKLCHCDFDVVYFVQFAVSYAVCDVGLSCSYGMPTLLRNGIPLRSKVGIPGTVTIG